MTDENTPKTEAEIATPSAPRAVAPHHQDFVMLRIEGILSEAALLAAHWLGPDARSRFVRAAVDTFVKINGEYERRRQVRADMLADLADLGRDMKAGVDERGSESDEPASQERGPDKPGG